LRFPLLRIKAQFVTVTGIAEIAYHENRLEAFKHWYKGLMESCKRFQALRAEMDRKVGPVLLNRK
jgi:hypothetical protein